MDYQEYATQIKDKFMNTRQTNMSGLDTLVTYDEIFKWEWAATKLKIFSFCSYASKVDENLIRNYTENCLQYAYKNKKGLLRGFQNGIVSYSILASEHIDSSAIDFVSKRELYYYKENIVWGVIYDSFLNQYILRNFVF